METISFPVQPRTDFGTGAAHRLRRSGLIPVVMYRGGQPPLSFALDPEEFEFQVRKTGNRNVLVEFEIDGQRHVGLIKEHQRNPSTQKLLHIDFYEVSEDQLVDVKVRVEPVGRAAGVRIGGTLRIIRPALAVRCLPGNIPEYIEVDVTDLEVGMFFKVADVKAPEGVTVIFQNNFNVIGVAGKQADDVE